ncbi:MAG: InlB B-repeat-containing protein, partial [Bacilli bacterium]|nr:InlB B-repeat-containing protein [Bacilli bacterium]
KITFDAKYYNESNKTSNMIVSYQLAGSSDWVLVKTIELTDSYVLQEIDINKDNVKIRIDVTTKSANIDNLKVYGLNVPKPKYEVLFNLDYEGAPSIPSQVVKHGFKAIAPETPTREGYDFLGWYLGENEFNFNTPVSDNIELVAIWEEEGEREVSYEVTIKSSGRYGSGISDGQIPTERLSILNPGSATIDVGFSAYGSTNTIFNNSAGEIRLYAKNNSGGTLKIEIESGYKIESVSIETSDTNGGFSINGEGNYTYTKSSRTLDFESSVQYVEIQNISTAQVRLKEIKITYSVNP